MKNKIRMFLPLFLGLSTTVLADYYVVINGSLGGPYIDQLQSLKNQGALTKESLVWQQGMAAWPQAGSRSDLQNLFTALAPPPMPANNASVLPPPISPTSSSQMMPAPSDSTPITQSEVDEHNRMSMQISSSPLLILWMIGPIGTDSIPIVRPGNLVRRMEKIILFASNRCH